MRLIVCELLIAFLLLLTLCSCQKEPENQKELNLSVKLLTEDPECNHLKSAGIIRSTPNSQSCIEYSFDQSTKKLLIKHINAGFNCCPESLWCTATYRNDSIVIQEFEKHIGCKCNCLYDLEMEVEGVESGNYQLRVIEPYLGTQKPLIFTLDLKSQKQGSFCVTRKQYPWGE
jgi:hypothetical protein